VATGDVYQKNADTKAWSIYKYADGTNGIKAAYEPVIYVIGGEYTTKNGDYVIDQSTGELYQMINGVQTLVKDLTDGFSETLYYGTTVPGTIEGSQNGDVYVDTKTGNVYQMANGSWGSPTENIIGNYSTTTGNGVPYMLNGSGTPALGNGNGGAIFSNENLTLTNVTVQNNNAANSGGGVYVTGANLTLTDGTSITGNNAENQGGGIYINAGTLNLTGSEPVSGTYHFVDISSNNAELGGGVYAINANVISHLAKVHDNNASYGGGFDLDSSLLTMT
jgi:predicted outer membrane repeat protein